jgi:3-deoxy-D-manno-octulosonic-acid transferase
MIRALYTVVLHLAIPVVWLRLWWRSRREPGYAKDVRERFGNGSLRIAADTPSIWVHAVSVGEVRAAIPLIGRLRGQYPEKPIVISVMTPTGRRTARETFSEDVHVVYLPYDLPWAMRRFIGHINPRVLIVMETEIWPNMLAACEAASVPRYLVNARLSEKSLRGYTRNVFVRALARNAIAHFDGVLAQTPADLKRLKALGALNAQVTGNVKFDLTLDEALIAQGREWKKRIGRRRVIMLASTREHEERPLIQAFTQTDWSPAPQPLLLVVPRHPARFNDVCNMLESANLVVGRRSSGTEPSSIMDAWLGDSMGEMQTYYAMCDVAIIGGSFQPLGGQNLIEAAAVGKPIIMGPSTFNFAEAAALATDAGAMLSVSDASAAMREAAKLINDDNTRRTMAQSAHRFAAAHGGATARTVSVLAKALCPAQTE